MLTLPYLLRTSWPFLAVPVVAVLRARKDLQGRRGLPDLLAQRVQPVLRDPLAQLGLKARQARMVRKGRLVLLVQQVQLGPRAFPDLLVRKD